MSDNKRTLKECIEMIGRGLESYKLTPEMEKIRHDKARARMMEFYGGEEGYKRFLGIKDDSGSHDSNS
jgi:hypothetical protein